MKFKDSEMAKQARNWDAVSPLFDTSLDKGVPNEVADNVFILWPAATENLKRLLKRPARVLDFGCGTGGLCNMLYQEGYEVQGIDASKAMIEIARRNSPAGISYRIGSEEVLNTYKYAFEAILSMMVFQFIEDVPACLAAFHGLLSAGGIVSVAVFNPAFVERCASAGKPFINLRRDGDLTRADIAFGNVVMPVYIRTEDQYREIFSRGGFSFESSSILPFTAEFVREHNWTLPSDVPEFLLINFFKN